MEATLSLYDLTAQQQAIEAALIENGGELTPELEELLAENTEALTVKVDGYNKLLRTFEGAETALDAEIRRLTALKNTAANAQKSLRGHLQHAMEENGITRLDGSICKAYLTSRKSLEVADDFLGQWDSLDLAEMRFKTGLPDYIDLELKLNKTALKAAIEGGAPVAGAQIISKNSITIR